MTVTPLGPAPVPRGDPKWGEVLQLPNLRSQFDLGSAARDRWMAANGAMGDAQLLAMNQLNDALKAQRDAKMAEIIAANTPKGGGGGGGRRGGGGSAPALTAPSYVAPTSQWDYNPTTAPAPAVDYHLYPSDIYGPNSVYHPKHALPGQKGYIPPRPKAAPVVKPKPSKYKVVLS